MSSGTLHANQSAYIWLLIWIGTLLDIHYKWKTTVHLRPCSPSLFPYTSRTLYSVTHPLQRARRDGVWSTAASNVNSFLGIFPKTCAQAHADKHWSSPSVCKCWHVCWLWFSAGACFSSRQRGESVGGALRRSYLASTLISLLPFVSHTSVQGLLYCERAAYRNHLLSKSLWPQHVFFGLQTQHGRIWSSLFQLCGWKCTHHHKDLM